MNIITNRCLGAYIYRDILKMSYKNPFIWSGIALDDFNTLFAEYEKIDFSKYEIQPLPEYENKRYCLRIDDKITVKYRHVIFDAEHKSPFIKGENIYYNKPYEYVVEKYDERLQRMTDKPIFFYLDIDDWSRNYELPKMAEKLKRHICILTTHNDYEQNEYVHIILVKQKNWEKVNWWNFIKTNYEIEISKMLEKLASY